MAISLSVFNILVLGTILAVLILLLWLYLRERSLRMSQSNQLQQLIKDTSIKSAELLSAAQLAETKIISEGKLSIDQLQAEFRKNLEQMIQNSQLAVYQAQKELVEFNTSLKKRSEEIQATSQKLTEERIQQLFERLEARLADFLVKTEQNTTSSIELELKSARQLIDNYRNQQMQLIDNNILAIMEQTMSVVLSKKLSLKDQLDLIYEALDKAKVEKFLT